MRGFRLAPLALGAALLLGSAPVLSAQAFEGIVTMRLKSVTSEILVYIKNGQTRMEMQGPSGAVAILANPEAGEQYLVLPSQKMVMVMKTQDAKDMADSLVKSKVGEMGTLTKTERTDRVADHSCTIYRATGEKSVKDVCLATDLGSLGSLGSLLNPMSGMGPMGMGRNPRGSAPTPPWASELIRLRAFPLRIADTTGVADWEITRLERKTLEPSLFVVPADYRRMDMPGRPPQQW